MTDIQVYPNDARHSSRLLSLQMPRDLKQKGNNNDAHTCIHLTWHCILLPQFKCHKQNTVEYRLLSTASGIRHQIYEYTTRFV